MKISRGNSVIFDENSAVFHGKECCFPLQANPKGNV
jgi:hypothetical protein